MNESFIYFLFDNLFEVSQSKPLTITTITFLNYIVILFEFTFTSSIWKVILTIYFTPSILFTPQKGVY